MPVPHKLTYAEAHKALGGWYVVSERLTADLTQIKRLLVAHGRRMFRVDRKYVGDDAPDVEVEWEIVYESDNLLVAVRTYNQLS